MSKRGHMSKVQPLKITKNAKTKKRSDYGNEAENLFIDSHLPILPSYQT